MFSSAPEFGLASRRSWWSPQLVCSQCTALTLTYGRKQGCKSLQVNLCISSAAATPPSPLQGLSPTQWGSRVGHEDKAGVFQLWGEVPSFTEPSQGLMCNCSICDLPLMSLFMELWTIVHSYGSCSVVFCNRVFSLHLLPSWFHSFTY